MKNFIKNAGEIIVAAAADVAAGGAAIFGSVLGIAVNAVATGDTGVFKTAGQYDLPCASADDIGVGDMLTWNGTELTLAAAGAGGLATCCFAVEAAGVGVVSVVVELSTGTGVVGV